jgi:hypothetical protein
MWPISRSSHVRSQVVQVAEQGKALPVLPNPYPQPEQVLHPELHHQPLVLHQLHPQPLERHPQPLLELHQALAVEAGHNRNLVRSSADTHEMVAEKSLG